MLTKMLCWYLLKCWRDLISLLWWTVGVWRLYASVQVAEGLAKLPLFPCSCGLTGRRRKKKIKKKRTDYNSTITSLHDKSPSLHPRGRREGREDSAHHHYHHNHHWQTMRRTPLGGGGREEGGESEMSWKERGGSPQRWGARKMSRRWRGEKWREWGKEGSGGELVLEGGWRGGRVEGRVYLIGDPGGTPLPEA